jgi:RNA polymerase sigma factor (sigma-70 family)
MTTLGLSLAARPGSEVSGERGGRMDFEDVFAREQRRLFGIAFAIIRDPLEAEDAVQETGLQAWRGWSLVADPDRSGAWLTTICVRHCVRRRRLWLRSLRRGAGDHAELVAATDHLRYDGRYVDLDRAYLRLSRQQRAVITLHYQHGHPVAACAALMGCSTGAAATHLSRALAKLRKELGDER